MLLLTKFDGTQFYLNAEMIQSVEETPSTVITLADHTKLVVKESAATVVDRFIQYRQKVNQPLSREIKPAS